MSAPPKDFAQLANRLELSLTRKTTGSWFSSQSGTWILEGVVDGRHIVARETYERVGQRRSRRLSIIVRFERPFPSRRVDRRGEWTRVCEGDEVRVSGGPVFSADDLEDLLRWATRAQSDEEQASPETATNPLAEAFVFSVEELNANREGRIHPDQAAAWMSAQRGGRARQRILAGAFLIIGFALAAWYHTKVASKDSQVDRNAVIAMLVAAVALSATTLALGAWGDRRSRAARVAMHDGRVTMVEGPVEVVVLRGRRGQGDVRTLRVGGRGFWVSKRQIELLTPGACYRVYCAGDQLLSLELSERSDG